MKSSDWTIMSSCFTSLLFFQIDRNCKFRPYSLIVCNFNTLRDRFYFIILQYLHRYMLRMCLHACEYRINLSLYSSVTKLLFTHYGHLCNFKNSY